jgi:hypothetical protein
MNVNLQRRSAWVSAPLGLLVGGTFVLHPTWIRFVALGLATLGIAAYYARKGRLRDALIPLVWFAVAVPVGIILAYVLIVGYWFTWCSHHVGSDSCA